MAFIVCPYAAFSNIKEGSSLGSCYTAHIKNYFKDRLLASKRGKKVIPGIYSFYYRPANRVSQTL